MRASRAGGSGRSWHRWRTKVRGGTGHDPARRGPGEADKTEVAHAVVLVLLAAAVMAPLLVTTGAEPASAANATVTATGRFTYIDDNGMEVGIRFAKVEIRRRASSLGAR